MLRTSAGSRRVSPGPDGHPRHVAWRRSEAVLWRVVLDDAVILPLAGQAEPFALAGGRRLWEALAADRRLDDLAGMLGEGASEAQLVELLDSLVAAGVVERTAG